MSIISKVFHVHSFSLPIVSMYVSFNCRDIVYKCSCGRTKIIRVCLPFDVPFPVKTTALIKKSELKKIANSPD